MYYFFLDESWRNDRTEWAMAIVLVPRDCYLKRIQGASTEFQGSRKCLTHKIDKFLREIDGLGLICHAELNDDWFKEKERDAYRDLPLPGIARNDDVWSWCVCISVAEACSEMWKRGRFVDQFNFSLYHDRYDLTPEHRRVLYNDALRKKLIVACQDSSRGAFGHELLINIGEIEMVEKKKKHLNPTSLQQGVWLADTILKSKSYCGCDAILFKNISGSIKEIKNRFIEKSLFPTHIN